VDTGLTSTTGTERWLSVPFGAGVVLAVDEIGLLTGRNNPYWGAQRTILRAAFFRRGAASEKRLTSTAEGDEAPPTATAR
jgi:hypothetical protein